MGLVGVFVFTGQRVGQVWIHQYMHIIVMDKVSALAKPPKLDSSGSVRSDIAEQGIIILKRADKTHAIKLMDSLHLAPNSVI